MTIKAMLQKEYLQVPTSCLEERPLLKMFSPLKGISMSMHRELPLSIICHFYTEKKCPCMERTSSKTATNTMLAFIIYNLLCVYETEAKS